MGTVRFWADQTEMPPIEVAARAHHLLVRTHPFGDVNGRITRLYADLVMLALTGDRVLHRLSGHHSKLMPGPSPTVRAAQ